MIRNEGAGDRIGRLVLAAAAVLLGWWVGFGSPGGVLFLALAALMLVRAAVGFRPAHRLLKVGMRPLPHRIPTSRAEAAAHL